MLASLIAQTDSTAQIKCSKDCLLHKQNVLKQPQEKAPLLYKDQTDDALR
jgi:hypothetical protein